MQLKKLLKNDSKDSKGIKDGSESKTTLATMSAVDISVIIPTFRPSDYLWQCLGSLRRQTLEHGRFEVVVVVNGEREPYYSSIERFASDSCGDMNIRLLYSSAKGVSEARNMGLEMSQGSCVCFVDDDDWLSDNYLESLLAKASADSIVVANVRSYDEQRNIYVDDYLTRAFARNARREQPTLLQARSFFSSSCVKIIPRSVIADSRFDTRFANSEDALFMATLSKRISSIRLATADTIYFRRQRASSARHRRSRMQALADTLPLAKAFLGVYLSDVRHYSLPFFTSRILALLKHALTA